MRSAPTARPAMFIGSSTEGLEFARAETREAFYLVLDDAWHREFDPRPVTL